VVGLVRTTPSGFACHPSTEGNFLPQEQEVAKSLEQNHPNKVENPNKVETEDDTEDAAKQHSFFETLHNAQKPCSDWDNGKDNRHYVRQSKIRRLFFSHKLTPLLLIC
jgi:hypothetical protein